MSDHSSAPTDEGAALTDPDLETLAVAHRALMTRLHVSRSQFLSAFNEMMGSANSVVITYFRPDLRSDDLKIQFRTWLLARLSDQAKVDLVSRIAQGAGFGDVTADLRARLSQLLRLRNVVAHSTLGPDHAEDDIERWALEMYHGSTRRRGYELVQADPDELDDARRQTERTGRELSALAMAVAAVREGDSRSPSDIFAEQLDRWA